MSFEQEQNSNWWTRLKDQMQHTYRLVIMNNETFEEIGSYRLTLLNVWIGLSTIVVIVALFITLLIVFTPLRKYVPGYGDIRQDGQVMALYQQVAEMEKELEAYRTYSESFRRMLVNDVETAEDIARETGPSLPPDSLEEVERSEADEQLRREIEFQEIGEVARQSRTANFSPRNTPLEQLYFTPPLNGEISAEFMSEKNHYGVDILAPKNTAIKSAMDGFVFLSDWTLETGNTIGIQHSNDLITFYKHNSVLLKSVGSYVKAGEAVAIIGNTGTLSDGPHLHFELWHKGKPINPTEYINF